MPSGPARIDEELLRRIFGIVAERNVPLAALSIDELASDLGISRMTLYRRIGSRQALNDAVAAMGMETGEEPDARDRAILAAAELIRRDGIGALTLESVALQARCTLPTIYTHFGSRSGLLTAVFERHMPVLAVRDALVRIEQGDDAAFRATVGRAYRVILDAVSADRELFRALLAEALRDPSGEIDQFLVTRYVPTVASHIVPWIVEHMEREVIQRMPAILVLHQFLAPILLHTATRPLISASGAFELPTITETCDQLAEMFRQAVMVHESPAR